MPPETADEPRARRQVPTVISGIKALTFDVFGTVVDWRSSIAREGRALGTRKGLHVDWDAFADAWRAGYAPAMNRVRTGELPWTTIDVLHRMILDELLQRFRIVGLSESEIDDLNRTWHRLKPWPDALPGLQRLRTRYTLATLSNGNMALLVNMAKHAGLPWDCVLSAELVQHYKPDREVYVSAARLLGLDPSEVMMVAAHPRDLDAARSVGFRTAFVSRPLEFGPGKHEYDLTACDYEIVAVDFRELATRLGV